MEMILLDKEKELGIIKNRLQKAYSMTIEDQKKWYRKINELESDAARLEGELDVDFSDDDGVKLLIAANKELSKELSEQRWGAGIEKFFAENPKARELLDKACDDVDLAFRTKSLTVLILKLDKYKEAYKFVEKTYADSMTYGFRELTADESKKVNKDLEQIGWV